MPDIPYYGGEAGVLPDNTNAMLHFSSQFAQLEQQKIAQEKAARTEEQQRQNRLNAAISTQIYDKNRLNNDLTNPAMQRRMNEMAAQYPEMMDKMGESYTLQKIYADAADLNSFSQKIKQTNEGIVKYFADQKAANPGFDAVGGAHIAATNAFMKKDKNGKWIEKPFEEIDPNADYGGQVMSGEHAPYLWPDAGKQWNADIKAEKVQPENAEPEYDANWNVTKPGYKSNISRLVQVVPDGKGGHTIETKSELYKLPGTDTPFVDPATKQPVKVLPDNLYNDYNHGAIQADVERRVRAELEKPANFNGSGESNFSPDSEYATMLRKKFMYEKMQDNIKGSYQVSTVGGAKQSFQMKERLKADERANESLAIQRSSLGVRQATYQLAARKYKDKGSLNEDDIPNMLANLDEKHGQDFEVVDIPAIAGAKGGLWSKDKPDTPATYKTVHLIPSTIDPKDIDMIAGKKNSYGERPVNAREYILKDGTTVRGWEYDSDLNQATGQDDKHIDGDAVQRVFINSIKKQTLTEVKRQEEERKNKAANPATAPVKKIKGTDSKLY